MWLSIAAVLTVLLETSPASPSPVDPLAAYRAAAAEFESDIIAFEETSRRETYPDNAILFFGSSSIRLWKEIAKDMRPWPVIQRGYGGACYSDMAIFAPRVLKGLKPRAVVLFAANDIRGKPDDKTPDEVWKYARLVVEAVERELPEVPVFIIAVTPTPSRFDVWPRIRQANEAMRKGCQSKPNRHFIETQAAYLRDQKPRPELFEEDRLHQTPAGYKIWSGLIRHELTRVLGQP